MGAHQPGRRPPLVDLTPQLDEPRFASVVLVEPSLSHLERAFTYEVPAAMHVAVGSLVRAPFRGRKRRGVVVGLALEPDVARTLPLAEVLGPGLDPATIDLCRWVAQRYLSTMGEALATALPARVVSEESATHPAPAPPSPMTPLRFEGYTGAARLVSGAPGGFVWRPRSDEDRTARIASMVSDALARGRGALVLIPEVRVSGEVVAGLRAHFGDAIAWLGSDASARERYRDWLALRSGAKRLAVGGRAAVFAPIADLGLIVVDDEGHAAYKEARAPRFHARSVAAERARRVDATLILIGIPPSMEARSATERGPYTLIAPDRRSERAIRPPVTVIDRSGERLVPTTMTLRLARAALDRRQRVVIIAHRGGDNVQRIAERATRILGAHKPVILEAGAPTAAVTRAVRGADLIVATPFIAKDLNIDGVGLLAFCDVDAALVQAEYRAPEDAFATWWRAARWVSGGHVTVETAQPDHPAIRALSRWDPDLFYRSEATRRREAVYPPFAAIARIDAPPDRAKHAAEDLAVTGLEVLGPIEGAASSVIVVRAPTRTVLLAGLGPVASVWRAREEPMRIDVDPWEVLVPKWRSSRS